MSLSPDEERELLLLLEAERPTLWTPQPGPQTLALECEADELFYGGAAGGGKTDLVIGLGLTQHRRSIIYRREYPQLRQIIDRAKSLLGDRGRYNGTDKVFRVDDGERILELGAVRYEDDVSKYQGRPHDFKAFDELPHFTLSQYQFLGGWARTDDPKQRVRIVSTGNPPTSIEGGWVRDRWAPWLDKNHPDYPARPGELRWYATIDGDDTEVDGPAPITHKGELIQPRSRTFIPARVEDNAYYMATGYKATLQSLPEPLRSQMLLGDFGAGAIDDEWQLVPTAWIREAQRRWHEESPFADQERTPDVETADGNPPVLTAMAVDVARGGDDRMAIARAYGAWVAELTMIPGIQVPDGQAAVSAMRREHDGIAPISIDMVGWGASPYDIARQEGMRIYGVNVASASVRKARQANFGFVNLRAELFWMLREALDPNGDTRLCLPPDRELEAEIAAHRWEQTARGVRIEEKAAIKSRLGRSPDKADTLALLMNSMRIPR